MTLYTNPLVPVIFTIAIVTFVAGASMGVGERNGAKRTQKAYMNKCMAKYSDVPNKVQYCQNILKFEK